MAKTLPNINKPVPEATDPALIKPVSDAIEAVDQAIGAKPSTLTTTAKTIVPAINELQGQVDTLEANSSLSEWADYPTDVLYGFRIIKIGRIVTITGAARNAVALTDSYVDVFTLPQEYWPLTSGYFSRTLVNRTDSLSFYVSHFNGLAQVRANGSAGISTGAYLDINISYIAAE